MAIKMIQNRKYLKTKLFAHKYNRIGNVKGTQANSGLLYIKKKTFANMK